MARWLVALAVVLVSRPVGAGGFRVEDLQRKITSTASIVAPSAGEPTLAAVTLDRQLRAIDRIDSLDVVDAHSGKLIATTPLAMGGIQSVSRVPRGDVLVKTHGDLVAIDRASGRIRWRAPTSSIGNAVVSRGEVVDAWVDRTTHRYGLVSRDPIDGHVISKIDLGSTDGWYDVQKIEIAPDGPDEVLVSAVFGRS
jgi:outer membrane protein assembly factor BamB